MADVLHLANGTQIENVTVSKVEPDKVRYTTADGGGSITLSKLSPEDQAKFGYDPKKAEAFSDSEKQKREAAEAEQFKKLQAMATAKQRSETAKKNTKEITLLVQDVAPEGVLADLMEMRVSTVSSGMARIGGGGGAVVTPYFVASGKSVFIKGAPSGLSESQQITVKAFPAGTFLYQSRTLACWQFVEAAENR